jgi:hypothetical protein
MGLLRYHSGFFYRRLEGALRERVHTAATRQSRLSLFVNVAHKSANLFIQAVLVLLNPLSLPLYTLPTNNSKEFPHF